MCAVRLELRGVGIRESSHVACEFYHCHLHTQADAEHRHLVQTCIADRLDHALDATVAETAGNDDAVAFLQHFRCSLPCDLLGVDPQDLDSGIIDDAAVMQCLCHGQIRILECHILAHQTDGHILVRIVLTLGHCSPLGQIRLTVFQTQVVADAVGQSLVLQHHGNFIQRRRSHILNNIFFPDVAEHTDLPLHILRNFQLGTANDHVRLDADGQQFLDGVLGRLGFQLVGAGNVRHQGNMDVHGVSSAHLGHELTDRLQERCAFDIAYCTADLCDDHIRIGLLADTVNTVLDLVGDVRNYLYCTAQIVAPALLVQNGPVNLTGGDIVVDGKAFVNKALIVTQIQVRLCAVIGNEHFAVLIRTHRAGVNIDIRIKLLNGDLIASGFQQATQRSRSDSLTQTGHNAAGDEYIFWHI